MSDKPLKILILSSRPPEHSANLGGDTIYALKKAGHDVDFLTTDEKLMDKYRWRIKLRTFILQKYIRLINIAKESLIFTGEYLFPCIIEKVPPIPSFLINKVIKKNMTL